MSGMYRNAVQCMEKLRKEFPQRKLVCIDTKCASLGEGYLVREAMRKQAEDRRCKSRSVVRFVCRDQKNLQIAY